MSSAVWFSEIFTFTAPASWQLHWTINGGYGAPDKLNERPIYLRTVFILLAIVHATIHNWNALSLLTLSKSKERDNAGNNSVTARVMASLPAMGLRAGLSSVATSVLAPFLYHGLVRSAFWRLHIVWAKLFANIPKSESNPPSSIYLGSGIFWGFVLSVALSLTWQLNIVLFQFFMLRKPVKNGMLLSALSKDPNGTLLNGLSAKMQLVKTLAFWELDIIARTSPERRMNIFGDFERPMQEPVFTSIISAAQGVVRLIQTRIHEAENPTSKIAPTKTSTDPANDSSIQHLPRLLPNSTSAKTLIYQDPNTGGNAFTRVSKEVKLLGSSNQPLSPPRERLQRLADQVTPEALKYIEDIKLRTDQLPVTRFLGVSSTRVVKSTILGAPIANPDLISYAISSSTTLLVASLTEDAFGKAVKCVPSTIQCFASTVFAIEAFVQKHTNGGFVAEKDATELRDIINIHKELKAAIAELLDKFQLFLNDVGLSIRDLNETRKALKRDPLFTVVKGALEAGNQTKISMPPSREMEEAGKRRVSEQPKAETAPSDKRGADNARPGRLFKQLDEGSTYQESLRKRRNSTKHRGEEDRNSLAPRNRNSEMVDNVLGAKDFGGLQSRRAARVDS